MSYNNYMRGVFCIKKMSTKILYFLVTLLYNTLIQYEVEGIMYYDKVKQLICEQLGKSADKVDEHTKIVEDLGADSLDVVELLMSLEDEFGLSLPDEVAMQLKTVGDIVDYIEKNKKS